MLGQHSGTDTDFGRSASEDKGIVDSSFVTRPRLKVIKDQGQSGKKTCGERADFERRYQEALYHSATYTVQGWRQSDGSLWKVNAIICVDDKLLNIREQYLISSVEYSMSSSGMLSKLQVIKPDGYKRDGSSAKSMEGDSVSKWKGVVK